MSREPRHGTPSEYTNFGCRCELCTDANAVAHAEYMERNPKQRLLARLDQRLRYWTERYDLAWERRDQDMLNHAQERRDAYMKEIRDVKGAA